MSPAFEHAELGISPRPNRVSRAFEHAELGISTRGIDADRAISSRTETAGSGGAGTGHLAERQAALVAALVAGAPDPAGFDSDRLAAARRALLRKRAGEAALVWPLLATSFGDRWASTFAAHCAGREPGGALRDGWDLARALRAELTADAAAELAGREALLRYDGRAVPRPRRFARARIALVRMTR